MIINIKDYKVTNELKTFTVNEVLNKINLSANVPINTTIYLVIHGLKKEHYIPFSYVNSSKQSNNFQTRITFTDAQIDYITVNSIKTLTASIVINNITLEDTFNILVNPQILPHIKGNSVVLSLMKEVSELRQELHVVQKKYPSFVPVGDLQKGAIPVATGVGNTYHWDLPFKDIVVTISKMMDLIAQLSEQNLSLTTEVNDLKQQVHDHIYEQYQLI